MALCMAVMEALRMFIWSISRGEHEAIAHEMAAFLMSGARARRCAGVSFLESSRPGRSAGEMSGGSITAAAATGPASGPRPASSAPASCRSGSM